MCIIKQAEQRQQVKTWMMLANDLELLQFSREEEGDLSLGCAVSPLVPLVMSHHFIPSHRWWWCSAPVTSVDCLVWARRISRLNICRGSFMRLVMMMRGGRETDVQGSGSSACYGWISSGLSG